MSKYPKIRCPVKNKYGVQCPWRGSSLAFAAHLALVHGTKKILGL